jgi:hypothetical protein
MRPLQYNPVQHEIELSATPIVSDTASTLVEVEMKLGEFKAVQAFDEEGAETVGRWFLSLSRELRRKTQSARKQAQKQKREGKGS